MNYVDMSSLETYLGEAAFAAWREAQADAERALEHCELRMLRRIIPNAPRTPAQKDAFRRAVYAQLRHESETPASGVLDGQIQSFRLNGFSATLKSGAGDACFPAGLSPDARALLHMAGLSCREVGAC